MKVRGNFYLYFFFFKARLSLEYLHYTILRWYKGKIKSVLLQILKLKKGPHYFARGTHKSVKIPQIVGKVISINFAYELTACLSIVLSYGYQRITTYVDVSGFTPKVVSAFLA